LGSKRMTRSCSMIRSASRRDELSSAYSRLDEYHHLAKQPSNKACVTAVNPEAFQPVIWQIGYEPL